MDCYKSYSREDLIAYSLMYSDVEINWRFSKKKIPDTLLYGIYYASNNLGINIFSASKEDLTKLKKEVLNNTYYKNNNKKKYEQILNELFLNGGIEKYIEKVNDIISKCKEDNIKIITLNDKKYPKAFNETLKGNNSYNYPPFVLYVKGNLPDKYIAIGIVGTRKINKLDKSFAFECGETLAKNKVWNISGLAKGCDEWGHKGSINGGGYTGAILGQGLSQPIYPKSSVPLAEEVLKNNGFLLSELPPDTKVNGIFLVLRDRLQSAFNNAIFVIKTGEKGGTLHTVNYALKYGKEVYVWEPSNNGDINEVLIDEKFQGNFILLGKKESPNNFKIKNINKYIKNSKIKPIYDIKDLENIIDKLRNTKRNMFNAYMDIKSEKIPKDTKKKDFTEKSSSKQLKLTI